MSRRLLERTLRGWGHEVVVTCDGAEAWAALQQEDAAQLAILDWMMPGLDGAEVCRRVRATPATRSVYILMLTAKGEKSDLIAGLAEGANDYVTKPFNREELQARVQVGVRGIEIQRAMADELMERRRAEEALRRSEEKYRSLVANIPDVTWTADRAGNCVFISTKVERMYGFTPEEIYRSGKSLWFGRVHPDDLERLKESYEALYTQNKSLDIEYRIQRKDGDWVWLHARAAATYEINSMAYADGVFSDISERKRLAEALGVSEEKLRQSQKLEAVGQLAGGIAHDFNNILTAITGYSELSLRSLAGDNPVRPNLEEIKKAADRAASLTRQLLAFSRKQILQPKVLDLNLLVTDIGKMLLRVVPENIELVTVFRPEAGWINADPGQIEQVLMNLVVNARDAMPPGGKITIETANVELDENFARMYDSVQAGPHVMLAVSDTGCGMDAETQRHIFDPFFTTKEVGKGTGLGLSTVYGIVKQSGGSIWVNSEVGVGTTFKIYLPRHMSEAGSCEDLPEPAALRHGSETILLVEDETMVRSLARTVLQESGYRVLEAAQADEALRLCEQHKEPIHLMLTDVVMPQVSGPELATLLLVLRPETRVLYMSGCTDDDIVHHGVLDPGTPFIGKPFTPHALVAKVQEVLRSVAKDLAFAE